MAVRSGLVDLISRVRLLINDTSGDVFSDNACANALDQNRFEMRWFSLRPIPTFAPSSLQYLDYYAEVGNWAADYKLQNAAFTDISGSVVTFEPLIGHWTFRETPAGIAVRATGTTYDLYATAADLLEWQAAQVALSFDFAAAARGGTFSRSQQQKGLLALAQQYRERAQMRTTRVYQSETPLENTGSGIVYPTVGAGGYGW